MHEWTRGKLEKTPMIWGLALMLVLPSVGAARGAENPGSLLDRLTGQWVLEGTIAGETTTHDVEAKWVLDRQYLQIHEISREEEAPGKPKYEAIVYITWEEPRGEYSCLWLDSTGNSGLSNGIVGHAKPAGDEIPLLFKDSDGSAIHNTFTYDPSAHTWKWKIDNEKDGRLSPFARVTLRRK